MSGDLKIAPGNHLSQPKDDCFFFFEEAGMIEFAVSLADQVRQGNIIARIWHTRHTGTPAHRHTGNRSLI